MPLQIFSPLMACVWVALSCLAIQSFLTDYAVTIAVLLMSAFSFAFPQFPGLVQVRPVFISRLCHVVDFVVFR